ncbi:MAG: hypothetical protein A2504_10755 [Bdellovibrionales bacterium RIFOXYD12_FULL_39_22]|nr:MAG: hypothetical protein A2385_14390 [Bdellovibrionales bacterium RIFOXYB1_FULL_39_21]OFZ40421.1 MAG: hypothetical protein A2485_03080 [Bdellovibrionales bacterium RIFOXYC12_FULL_39_17]OFZ49670.1 MAG: hypothetical protein A2404_09540 [Bdellovibrionales bacterium RIFOXYC1_FULL_39_130]OFZ77340.1 MAG: hypothetical protein A2560_06205 [Bdellovibrionales bacterium RIFOXYD1_FULL_39_84]OFZ95995.1 MAG: hypothetical protein A2504_10755 [Bdellovibrionales bacterium RIFOXYD12_FULL_39_22]HLE11257.1 Fl
MGTTTEQQTGVFINGKAQIIEMMQYLRQDERERILKQIKIRNPVLADELVERSITFENLSSLSDVDLRKIFTHISAPILGIALKGVSVDFQRRLLGIVPRDYAEQAFSTLVAPIENEARDSRRAQNKIVSVLISLNKRKQISV